MNDNLRKCFHEAYIKGDKNEMMNILKINPPYSLIKFCNTEHLENITNNTIWLSSPKMFNDPFDCVLNIDYEKILLDEAKRVCEPFGKENVKKLFQSEFAREIISKKGKEVKQQLSDRDSKIQNNVFVSCFTEKDSLYSSRMWGYYSDSHNGICLEYDFVKMNIAFPVGIVPMLYDDILNIKDDCVTDEDCRKFRLQIAYTKATEWSYEKEWRMFEENEEKEGQLGYIKKIIKPIKIYMGCNINVKTKHELKTICMNENINLFQMKMKPGTVSLDVEEIFIKDK